MAARMVVIRHDSPQSEEPEMDDFSLYDKILGRHLPSQVRNVAFGIIAVALSILALDGWRSVSSYYNTVKESTENLDSLAHVMSAQTEATFDLADTLLVTNVAILESGPLDAQAQNRMHVSWWRQPAHCKSSR